MPKVKTNSGAKKRFALTGTGKIKRKHAFHSHILTKNAKISKSRCFKSKKKENFRFNQRLLWCKKKRLDRC